MAAEAAGLASASAGLDAGFSTAVEILLATTGKAILTGIGKSGHIARKIAATLASTGTPAFFLHPAEAGHGDLGMIATGDTIIAFSHSGTATELTAVIEYGRRESNKLITVTGNPAAPLAQAADAVITINVAGEADPTNLAPTVSTTATLAVGDALAMALVKARGFAAEDFARTHPDGALGRRLLVRVADLMLTAEQLPCVAAEATLAEAIVEMSAKRLGMTLVVAGAAELVGIFTDGDLRRSLAATPDIHVETVAKSMGTTPKTVAPERLASEALALMEEHRITHLPVVADTKLVGLIDIHLLIQQRIA